MAAGRRGARLPAGMGGRRTGLIAVAALLALLAAGFVVAHGRSGEAAREAAEHETELVAGEPEGEAEREGELAPSMPANTVGPPLYSGKNTDGQPGSGGRAIAYNAGGRAIPASSFAGELPDARLFHTGYGGWEPTLGMTKDGTLFLDARNHNADPGIVRSRDGGLTWTGLNPDAHKVSLDPFLWVDTSTGSIFDSDIDPTVTCPPLSRSDDQGQTWTTSVSCGQADHQSVFGGPPPAGGAKPTGYPNVVYYCAISGGALAGSSTITGCSKSLDGAKTFANTGDPAFGPRLTGDPNQPNCDGGAGHGIVAPNGVVYVPRIWCGPPYVAISRDEGATWTQVQIADKPLGGAAADGWPHESGIAADRAGNLYYAYVAADRHPYLAISRDEGRHWSRPIDVMPPGVDHMTEFTASIDAADPGKVAIVFMGTNDPKSAGAKTRWNAYVVTSADALAADPVFLAASMNDPATNALWIGDDCGDLRCGNIGDFLDVVIGSDGTAWTALVDSCPNGDQCTPFGVTDPRGEAMAGQLVGGPPLAGTVADQTPAVELPAASAARCVSRRRFRIRLHRPRRGKIRSARVYVNGKRVKALRGSRITAAIDLRGLPRGRYTVRVVVTTSTGRTITRTRAYRTCTPPGR